MSGRSITIVVAGDPVAQGRPRMTTVNGSARAYDPPRSRDWKQYARLVAQEEMKDQELFQGQLSLSLRVFRNMPASFSLRRRASARSGRIMPTTRPDLDNYVKAALDALNGVVFKDDSQIVNFHEPFGKWYSDKPRVEIEVKELT